MQSLHSNIDLDRYFKPNTTEFKSFRDELVSKITDGINKERIGTSYKPISKRTVAIRINLNPALSHRNNEIENLYRDCVRAGTFKKFFWATQSGNKLSTKSNLGRLDGMGI